MSDTQPVPVPVGRSARSWVQRGLAAFGAAVLAAGALLVIFVGINRAAPYQPFIVKSYVVTPQTVCTGQPVTALITRRFTRQVDSFKISETWVTAGAGEQSDGKPVTGGGGSLPPKLLTPSDDYKTAQSPVIRNAPDVPGTYRVRIETTSQGRRFGLPTSGAGDFASDDSVTVLPRSDRRCQ
jgi:hypothetical protein